MARLKVYQNGQVVSQHELDVSRELMVGRGETCDIVLAPERGISRQHFRVRFAEEQWIVEVLSRYGELYKNGEKQSIFPIRDGTTFTVPPYEFVFEEGATGQSEASESGASLGGGEEDKTHVGFLPSIAYLKLTDHRGQHVQSFRLEGQGWIGGRDTSCSVFIDNPRISRQQFEIQKQDEAYFIRDLGSVNGTLLNGRPISNEDWTQLASSDFIAIADWTLQFELRDASFEQRLQEVDPAYLMPTADMAGYVPGAEGGASPYGYPPGAYPQPGFDPGGAPGFDPMAGLPPQEPPPKPGMKLFGKHIPGLNPVRLAIGVILILGMGYAALNDPSGEQPGPQKVQTPFDKLPPDKQQVVKQLYLTAQSLLAQGRYELARQEIIKLHQIIPYYEDSKQIEETANTGLAMLAEREKAEAEERQRAMIEEKIQKQVAECRSQLNENSEMMWLEGCLSPVMEFNPEHPSIVALRNEVALLTEQRNIKLAQQKEYQERVARLQAIFDKAVKVDAKGKPIPAIAAYESVTRTGLPDPRGLVKKAKQRIAELQELMAKRQAEAEQKAEVAYRGGQLKQAIMLLREGMVINPENEVLKGKHTQYMGELRKQMMTYYQEGILEESVGEVETAKSKWRKIQDLSLPGEDYYEKSRIKLRKYGAL